MQNLGSTVDPATGRTYRITAPKVRTAAFAAVEATVMAAKEAQADFMRRENLAFDPESRTTVYMDGTPMDPNSPVAAEMATFLAATRAAQQAVKAYKQSHPDEFRPQMVTRGIPIYRPRGGFRGQTGRGRS